MENPIGFSKQLLGGMFEISPRTNVDHDIIFQFLISTIHINNRIIISLLNEIWCCRSTWRPFTYQKKKKKLNMKIMDMLSKGFYMLGFLRCDLEGNMMRLICWWGERSQTISSGNISIEQWQNSHRQTMSLAILNSN